MTEKTPDKKEKKEPTDAQRLALEYKKSPILVARLLADIFQIEEELAVRNDKVKEILMIIGKEDKQKILKVMYEMANVVLQNTVSNLGDK